MKKILTAARASLVAFTLVEMLMTLLVLSIILAAMAPVITKRYNDKVHILDKSKVAYLTEPGTFDWNLPQGIQEFYITVVGAGGGGGAGMGYGCTVFTTTAVAQGSILGDDSYCSHVRGDGNINFAIPEGVEEIYVSIAGGAGGGGGGQAQYATELKWNTQGTFNWTTPEIVKGNRILVSMNGAGGGGGGVDQGGAGGGASGGFVNWTNYNVTAAKTSIPLIVGGGGGGGRYRWGYGSKGTAGYNGGQIATQDSGGGGGGASSFDGTAITAYGGGGGAGMINNAAGWYDISLWQTAFNYGASGRTGGSCGPSGTLGGKSGGDGAAGGGVAAGNAGANGTVGTDGKATGAARGGIGGSASMSGTGAGGRGQDFTCGISEAIAAGGAGGGGGGSAFGQGGSTGTACKGPGPISSSQIALVKAGTGAGGAGASCGWAYNGSMWGGAGGDGIVLVMHLTNLVAASGGQAGPVVPRSKVALNTSTIKAGTNLIVNVGKGGEGGDAMIVFPNGSNAEIRTINSASTIAGTTDLSAAIGKPGAESSVKVGTTFLARTASGGCGGHYNGTSISGSCGGYGSTTMTGAYREAVSSWHGHQSGTCGANFGTNTLGGSGRTWIFDGLSYCGPVGGTLASRAGLNASIGVGGSGGFPTARGGKGGDGYVKIEWGIPRNLNKTASVKYSGGGGSAGETIKRTKIKVSPVKKTIRYTVGAGGEGAKFDMTNSKVMDGLNGAVTVFGVGESFQSSLTAKGGLGGKSARVTSTIDAFTSITALTGVYGLGGLTNCTAGNNCPAELKGSSGASEQGGRGGVSSTGTGGIGGIGGVINGNAASAFDGVSGGGGGGGGGAAGNPRYGEGGKGANGYIKIEWQ